MKHIVLICHKAHLVSNSVNFIKCLFEKNFTVDVLVGNLSLKHVNTLLKTNKNSVFLLWQTEYLTPWLISMGRKVMVFPMYDGCGNAPKSYFKVLDKAYLFNFSKKLHERCVDAGVVSYKLTYYPARVQFPKTIEKEDSLFFWLRRPDSSLSQSNIIEFFSPYVENMHIHELSDDYDLKDDKSMISNAFISTSSWFEKKEDLLAKIAKSKYYLAPRESEGIGMAFLEAMQLGCIVFANNGPTHNQYIFHCYNGFLIDFSSGNKTLIQSQLKEAFKVIHSGKPIGENAKQFILEGEPIWKEQAEKITGVANTIAKAKTPTPSNWIEQKIGFFLGKVYFIHARIYFLFCEIFLKLGFFSDKSLSHFIKGIIFHPGKAGVNLIIRIIKANRRK